VAIPLKYKDHRTVPEDITIMRAVRLWYAPVAEMQVEMQIDPGAKMGMAFSRTKEGFVFVNTVWPGRWAAFTVNSRWQLFNFFTRSEEMFEFLTDLHLPLKNALRNAMSAVVSCIRG
jgi:hypothetical protein